MRIMAQWLPLALAGLAAGQTPQNQAETATNDEPAVFRTRVNLVMVPVVVRDRQGRATGALRQEDFQLFDRGKPQAIIRFSVEKPGSRPVKRSENAAGETAGVGGDQSAPADLPEHFIAYLFDDIHVAFADLARSRDAAGRNIDSLLATDRAAIFTTSGQTQLDFTGDRQKLHETLAALQPRPVARAGIQQCPDISYYMADMIVNKNDNVALQAALTEYLACSNTPPNMAPPPDMIRGMARQGLSAGEHETRVALFVVRDVLRRMAAMPGQRTIVLVSPGFLTPEQQTEKTEILDRAIRSNVVINSLDARGLDPMMPDITKRTYDINAERVKQTYDRAGAMAQSDVLAEFAHGTGGSFFQNNNDLDEGFRRLASAPEYYYVLGFSPQNLKLDGGFHGLKVALKNQAGLSAQARKGYYAPTRLEDAAATAKREVEEALFSREEMRELPVDLRTQFFKSGDQAAKVTVLMHVDAKKLRFRKADGRNYNDLTIVAALFDRNGNFVTGVQKRLEMRLLDETVEKRLENGLTVRSTLDAKPGTYMVRLVVRDSEGQLMAAENGVVEIP